MQKIWKSLVEEAKRYGDDTVALVLAPGSWTKEDYERAGAIAFILGGLLVLDESLDDEAQEARSPFTDEVSDETTKLGGSTSLYLSAGLFVGGVAFRNVELRDTGRDALEALLITHVATKYVLKPLFGRERPEDSDGDTHFRPFSGDDSFPSAHATQAFAVASVVSARSKGWVVPVLVYTLASVVAFDRVNDRVHFASDVFAGAVFGTVTGRFLVRRHVAADASKETVSIEPILVPNGIGLQIRF
jgi:hypothetical protein